MYGMGAFLSVSAAMKGGAMTTLRSANTRRIRALI